MNILIIRGYDSSFSMKETIEIYGKAVNITMEPIGKPVNLRKKFKNILSKYHLADYDQIYLVSMSSCMTSIIDKKYFDRVADAAGSANEIYILGPGEIRKRFGKHLTEHTDLVMKVLANKALDSVTENQMWASFRSYFDQ